MIVSHRSLINILPHSYPFLLIDRVLEFEEDKRIVCLKNVTINEEFFQGHFRSNPVMPGVLIIEAMAQASGLLLRNKKDNIKVLIAQVKEVRFKESVMPGDALYITSIKLHDFSTFHCFEVTANVNNKTVANGELVLAEINEDKGE